MAKYMTSHNLKNLTLINCHTIQSSTLCKIAITNPQLENIELSGNTPVTDSSFATIIDRCGAYLEYLTISNSIQLTDKSIRFIASRCKKIKQICLFNNTERISEDTLTAIITHCPTLEMISLSDSKCLGSLFFNSVVQRVNIEIASIIQHQLHVNSGLQKLCLGGVQRDMIHSKYMKELIDKSAPHLDVNSPIIRGNTIWWQRQHLISS
jgi:Ran GTPase-activating protein (RanGAP) involved in mRNA processing and transport